MPSDFTKAAQGLMRAACMSADELAAERGEGSDFVKIKRNSERLAACPGHDFEPDPDWRAKGWGFTNRTVRCRACGGDMKVGAAMNYLRGYAHGSGKDFTAITDAIWPPAPKAEGSA